MSGTTVAGSVSNPGPWAYQFSSPTSMIFDQYGYMYVLDFGNNRVQKWYPGSTYGTTVVSGSLYNPCGLQFDRVNNIVIADTYNYRIVSFSITCRKFTFKIIF
jgi:sugar lactone lactonase YvrE